MPFTIPNEGDAFHTNQAEPDKVDLDILVAGALGNGVIEGCAISQRAAGANMSVDVAAGWVCIDYLHRQVTAGNHVIGAAAANPVFPAITADSIVLAAVYVDVGLGAVINNRITDKRVMVQPRLEQYLGVRGILFFD